MSNNKFGNFIFFWISQSISQLGSAMTSFALIIWAYKQTNSAMVVSLMSFCSYLPYILVSIFAGSFIDRHKKKNVMLAADLVAVLCSLFIFINCLNDTLAVWNVYFVNLIIGTMNSFQSPAEQVALGIMVEEKDYKRASGMNSFSANLSSVFAPMLAAFFHSFFGLKGVLIIDFATFILAFVILCFFIQIPEEIKKDTQEQKSIFDGCKEGFRYLMEHKGIWYIILSMACMNFFSRLTYENILSPMILARSGGNDNVLGIVTGIMGFGGVLGGLIISFKEISKDNVKLIYLSAALSFLFGDMLMGLGQNVIVWSVAAVAASLPIPFINAGQNCIMYKNIPTEVQGRIFAVRNAIQFSTIPIAIILGGVLADHVFEPFVQSENMFAGLLRMLVGEGSGSGMAVMFLCTGVLGFITSICWYRNRQIRETDKA
ncbi:MAG: MFS transporter [Bacteroidales bacterium]|nr:MFS transporter [Clostridium sp.]MCM1204576.1 MFS transporter [Bacteroidales bacterium]